MTSPTIGFCVNNRYDSAQLGADERGLFDLRPGAQGLGTPQPPLFPTAPPDSKRERLLRPALERGPVVGVPDPVGLDHVEAAAPPLFPLVPDGQDELGRELFAVAGGEGPLIQGVGVPVADGLDIGDGVEGLG